MNIPSGIGNIPQPLSVPAPAATSGTRQEDNLKQSTGKDVAGVVTLTQNDAAKVSVSAGFLMQNVSGPDARGGRVEALQQAIAGGTYNVSASAVEDKLAESMLG